MNEFIQTLIKRWKSESPKLFKFITNFCVTLGTISLGILSANVVFGLEALGVAPIIFKICGYVLTLCGGMGLTSKLTVKDNDRSNV